MQGQIILLSQEGFGMVYSLSPGSQLKISQREKMRTIIYVQTNDIVGPTLAIYKKKDTAFRALEAFAEECELTPAGKHTVFRFPKDSE